jgi:poly-gamma-glutamate capsule biosynthesis protein CapA/YwtB (metallophosphatase superfamily)
VLRILASATFFLIVTSSFSQADSTIRSSDFLTSILDTIPIPPVVDTLVIMGVGDVMLGTNFPSARYLPPADSNMMALAIETLMSADITFANLEGTIINEGGRAKSCKDPTKCYVFRMPEKYTPYLVNSGIDLVGLANNHSGDFGSVGRKRTALMLDSLGLTYAGHEACPHAILEKDGITYGLCAFAPNTGTVRINNYKRAREIVTHLDSLCDIVIVSFHGGAEGPDHRSVTRKSEYYFGEHRGNVYEFAHLVVDCGADIVFGHGPHIVRAMEVYNDRLIAYSLGNFCTYARFNLGGARGYAPVCEVKTRKDGSFIKGRIHSFIQRGEGGPVPDINQAALREITRLTQKDFPNSGIRFEESGDFYLEAQDE